MNQLLLEKRRHYSSLLNQGHQDKIIKSYNKNKGTFQRELRQMLNEWWSNISKEVQKTSDLKHAKTVYGLLNKVFGQTSSLVTPLKSKDNTTLIKEPNSIMQRWQEHFKDLFHSLSSASDSVIDSIPQLETRHHLNRLPTPAEVERAVNQINTGKTPGLCGIPVELLQTGKKNILHSVYDFIVIYWSGLRIPQDWVDSILVSLCKGKGEKSICDLCRGIILLESIRKELARLRLARQNIGRKYFPWHYTWIKKWF